MESKSAHGVVYLISSPLTARDIERFGIDEARSRGLAITVIDLADLTNPKGTHNRAFYASLNDVAVHVAERATLEMLLPVLSGAALIICFLQADALTRASLPLFRLISRVDTPYLLWLGPVPPGWVRNRFITRLADSKDSPIKMLWRKDWFTSLLFRMNPSWFRIRPADYILDSNPLLHRRSRFAGSTTRWISGHSTDYETYLREKPKAGPACNQAVFLDQYLPFHPDFRISGSTSVEPGPYFEALRGFFDSLEQALGLKVIIAAHPRADYSRHPGVYGHHEVVKGVTARLVMESRLVISHATTAASFAVLARRPLVLAMTRDLARTGMVLRNVEELGRETGAPMLMLDGPEAIDFPALMRIDERRYQAYEEKFIRPPRSPELPLWKIVYDAVQEEFSRK